MIGSRLGDLKIVDLIDVVANESGDVQKLIEKAYDWDHTRKLETGKWFLATGTAALIGTVTLLAKENPPPSIYLYALGGSGTFGIAFGFASFWMAKSVAARLARVTMLANRLQEIRPFLRLLRTEDEA